MERLLQLNDEDDDATSKAAPLPSHMEQSHLEQAHMEQSHLEQAHMEQSHMEQSHMEQSHMEQSHMEQSHMEQSHMEQSHMEQSHMEQQQPYNHRQPDNSSQQVSRNNHMSITHSGKLYNPICLLFWGEMFCVCFLLF
jgi:hypothetical protein